MKKRPLHHLYQPNKKMEYQNNGNTKQLVTVTRDCEAALIPTGTPIIIPEDSKVFIIQSLGGSYTINVNGNLARVAADSADALGFEVSPKTTLKRKKLVGDGHVSEEDVWNQLRTCYDPEIPINIVELGLIYKCAVERVNNGNRVSILMTLTAPGCGMGEFLAEDVRTKVAALDNVTEVDVGLTFDPPWSQDMMSEAARLQTGMY